MTQANSRSPPTPPSSTSAINARATESSATKDLQHIAKACYDMTKQEGTIGLEEVCEMATNLQDALGAFVTNLKMKMERAGEGQGGVGEELEKSCVDQTMKAMMLELALNGML